MKGFLTILTLFTFLTASADNNCKSCDIEKVKIIYDHMDSLTFQIVSGTTGKQPAIGNANKAQPLWASIEKL